ncbi:MAG: hypothetical protein HWD92_09445 [Flavobacteriia bacterium]|nr:hypothetical protein [Flavobacteriia bacterium]
MVKTEEKFHKSRLRSSYLSVVMSITAVLLMLGAVGVMGLKLDDITKKLLEEYAFTVMLKNDAPEADVRQFQKQLDLSDQVISTEFITKEEAANEFQETLGEDFVDFLGYNPLSDAIEIRMKYNFVNTNDVESFKNELLESGVVSDIAYDPNVLDSVNAFVKRYGTITLIVWIVMIFISIALINSSIRLSIYSKRFTIKTMQLVGATKTFIQRPFMKQSAVLGAVGGLIASAILTGMAYYSNSKGFTTEELTIDMELMLMISGAIILFGTFLAWSCTFVAVKRYLKLKTDELYY